MPLVHAIWALLAVSTLGQYVQELALAPFEPMMVQHPSEFKVGQELTILPPCDVQSLEKTVTSLERAPVTPAQVSTPFVVTSQ